MEQPSEPHSDFVELLSYENLGTPAPSQHANIIKSGSVQGTGITKIEFVDGCGTEPSVFVHRNGDRIERIEFVCTCGKSTHLSIDYEDE